MIKNRSRYVMNFLAAASSAVCVVTIYLWVTSHSQMQGFQYSGNYDRFFLFTDGSFLLGAELAGQQGDGTWSYVSMPLGSPQAVTPAVGGFYWEFHSGYWVIGFPLWFVALLFACLPLHWFRARRRARAVQLAGCCKHCGYDLRATPDRCPECGQPNPRAVVSDAGAL